MARSQRIKTNEIQVEGLTELRASLKAMGPEFPRELRKVNKTVADLVAKDAKSAAQSIGGVAAHVAPSIKATAGQASAGVSLGGPGFEMAGGAEFGAIKHPQFKLFRGSDRNAGYFLYPSIRHDSERIETEYSQAINELIRKVGLA